MWMGGAEGGLHGSSLHPATHKHLSQHMIGSESPASPPFILIFISHRDTSQQVNLPLAPRRTKPKPSFSFFWSTTVFSSTTQSLWRRWRAARPLAQPIIRSIATDALPEWRFMLLEGSCSGQGRVGQGHPTPPHHCCRRLPLWPASVWVKRTDSRPAASPGKRPSKTENKINKVKTTTRGKRACPHSANPCAAAAAAAARSP